MNPPFLNAADEVRGIPLDGLLTSHGFKLRKEGVSFRAKDERFNIVIHSDKWFDNRAGVGGAGAIDLQMHLSGGDFRAACRVLSERFRPAVGGLAFPENRVRDAISLRRSFDELASQYAVPSELSWPTAHDYLVKTRGLDPDLIDTRKINDGAGKSYEAVSVRAEGNLVRTGTVKGIEFREPVKFQTEFLFIRNPYLLGNGRLPLVVQDFTCTEKPL